MKVFLIGVTGGSGSGKSTVVDRITKAQPDSICISQDNYYKSASFIRNENITSYNFDRPEALDLELMYQNLVDLKSGKAVDIPQYDFVLHSRKAEKVHIEPRHVIIVDGLMVLYDEKIRGLLDLKLFVDTPADIRLARRLRRDIQERGRTVESVLDQYINVVRPGHERYIEPCKAYADLIIPEGGYNENALDVLISHVQNLAGRL